jgi:hypothetical protein
MNKNYSVLFRKDYTNADEFALASRFFPVQESVVGLQGRTVIGRYSVLPNYSEVARDLDLQGSKLINSLLEHQYIANFDYYFDLVEAAPGITPKTYFRLQDVPKEGGQFIVKGRTNSRKHQWNELMFAKDYAAAAQIYCALNNDPVLSEQGLIVRDYVPLKTLELGVTGLPITNEWRFFYFGETCLAVGYYWAIASSIPDIKLLPDEAYVVAQMAASIIARNVNFFVVDVAETADGQWIVIECNDGQQSGLCTVDAEVLYSNLKVVLDSPGG